MKKYDFLKDLIVKGFEGENVRIIDAKTQKGQEIKNKEVIGSLWSCYQSNSSYKESVYCRYRIYCDNLNGSCYGVVSYNKFQFTIGFNFDIEYNNKKYHCYAYITKCYNNIAIEEA